MSDPSSVVAACEARVRQIEQKINLWEPTNHQASVALVGKMFALIGDLLSALTEARAALQEKGWQPIETAPKDGTRIIVAGPMLHSMQPILVMSGHWVRHTTNGQPSGSWLVNGITPTHWMPLPAAPSGSETGA